MKRDKQNNKDLALSDRVEIDGVVLPMSRRCFLKNTAFYGGVLAASQLAGMKFLAGTAKAADGFIDAYPLDQAENVIYSCCLQCHTACTIKTKILNGVMVKVDGNPYSPMNMHPHIDYATNLREAARSDGRLCPKGQAGVQTLYDPYRIRKVLKRKPGTKRGENKWVTIDFDKAVDEIVNGGNLFGEGDVEGLKGILAVRDPAQMAALKVDAEKVAKGKMSVGRFKAAHRGDLDLLIDPEHPDLGPKNNQFVFLAGRIEHGRKEFSQRIIKDALGSENWFEHTTVCEQSHHIAYKNFTGRYKDGKWHNGKEHMKPDVPNCEFVLFFGTSPFEANFGPTNWASYLTNAQARNGFKFAVVDPRLSHTAAKANYWLPVKPGADAALALGMMRWIIDKRRYNEPYLRAANRSAAKQNGDTTWSNATHLVRLSDDGRKGVKMLRGKECGIAAGAEDYLVSVNGKLVSFDPYKDHDAPLVGDLFAEGEIKGIKYKTGFALLHDIVMEREVKGWTDEAGIPANQLIDVAREFTSHGRKAVADMYRGPVQHTNGYHNGHAILTLNLLVGNGDWEGGLMAGGGGWHEFGQKAGQPFPLGKMHPEKVGHFGVPVSREKFHYEDTSLYLKHGYPAKRTWYPFTGSVYQEVIPSAADGYPYPIKALYLHKGTPGFSVPGANASLEALRDPKKIPLLMADDIVIGESSMYCDYIFPDTAIWERWGIPHLTPAILTAGSKVRQPVVESMNETCTVFGRKQHISMEAVLLALGEKLKAPGVGQNGFGNRLDFSTSEDFYLKEVANIAFGDKDGADKVPLASGEEMEIFRKARNHFSPAVFDEKRWKTAVGGDEDLWRRMVTVLNRGGRFEPASAAYEGGKVRHQFKSQFNLFVEHVALGKNCMSGENLAGMPIYLPVQDASGKPLRFSDRYPFQLITYKLITGGQSRTISDYWIMTAEKGENAVLMNRIDAKKLGLKDGDRVRLVGESNPSGTVPLTERETKDVVGRLKIIEGIRPGTVAASWSYGHWAYGSRDVNVDGRTVKGDPRRGTGICPNPVMAVDPVVKNTCLSDPIGGSCSFYDSRVNVVKA